jgi:hypothetical protein
MDFEPAFVADGEAPELAEPGEGALDHPLMAAQLLADFSALAGDARLDPGARQALRQRR